ncbi:D-alanyl-D-alanine carboxypeptidase family protein [Phenylobacterium montanum]|uniref:D-alanyl-D-alanine carboxypeptidase family protein n=1 Tax=Phenylobacterium montanum TaxID=2823693 RepID=A0A975FYF7_9CAUL|nr:D-alanyl-D-alanine carboxypeptidase family protein [Caulobacter sp. S6]QUD87232.1 D-alanyl-D-alanine carboxypeptidase family protein [Caulobacter sp. S6]
MRPLALALVPLIVLTLMTRTEARPRHAHPGGACGGTTSQREAARVNAEHLGNLSVNLFGRPETGWAIYAPAAQREIGSRCAAERPAFAAALARWQGRHAMPDTGMMDAVTLQAMKADWQSRRPFYALREAQVCPDPPTDERLAAAREGEMLEGGKAVRLRKRALRAWRRMVAAARRDRAVAGDPDALKLFSGFRSPEEDAARCLTENNCQGLVRAACSAHRTGLALDLNLGSAPGYTVDSTADPNRLFQSKTAAYRWLVRNARRYGFVNYVFEPWHWEWTGEKP